jgi:hypothetical protein
MEKFFEDLLGAIINGHRKPYVYNMSIIINLTWIFTYLIINTLINNCYTMSRSFMHSRFHSFFLLHVVNIRFPVSINDRTQQILKKLFHNCVTIVYQSINN